MVQLVITVRAPDKRAVEDNLKFFCVFFIKKTYVVAFIRTCVYAYTYQTLQYVFYDEMWLIIP